MMRLRRLGYPEIKCVRVLSSARVRKKWIWIHLVEKGMNAVKKWIHGLTFALILGLLTSVAFPAISNAEAEKKKNEGALLEQIMDLAAETRTLNSGSFGVGSLLDDVKVEWGVPDDDSGVAANYWDRNIRFIYDPDAAGDPITWIEDFDPALQQITLKRLFKQLGMPYKIEEAEGDYYVTYWIDPGYEITFVLNVPMDNQKSVVYLYYIK